MHEHDEYGLNTCSKCHVGPTQSSINKMGLSPINKIEKICKKISFPTQHKTKPQP